MTATIPEGTRTTMPREGTTPTPRDPVSARAQIGSIVEDRRREILKRLTGVRAELQTLVLELAVLDATAEVIGIVGIPNGEDGTA